MKSFYSIFPVIVLVGDLVGFAAGTTFFLKTISSDLESAMYSLCQMAGLGNMAYMMVVSFFLREKFTATVDSLLEIYRESECSDIEMVKLYFNSLFVRNQDSDEESMEILDEANNQSEWICKMYLIGALGGTFVSTWMISAASVLIFSMGGNSFDGRQQFRLFNVMLV